LTTLCHGNSIEHALLGGSDKPGMNNLGVLNQLRFQGRDIPGDAIDAVLLAASVERLDGLLLRQTIRLGRNVRVLAPIWPDRCQQ
jgi:hypothetical protein